MRPLPFESLFSPSDDAFELLGILRSVRPDSPVSFEVNVPCSVWTAALEAAFLKHLDHACGGFRWVIANHRWAAAQKNLSPPRIKGNTAVLLEVS
jgi:hypothetical protein